MAPTIVKIDAHIFHAATVCASAIDTALPAIRGVHIQPHPETGALIIATDGVRMFVAHDIAGVCRAPTTVDASPDLRRALDRIKDAKVSLSVNRSGRVTIPDFFAANVDGRIAEPFPEWTRVVDLIVTGLRKKTVSHASFNPRFMADWNKVALRLGVSKNAVSVKVVSAADDAPALVLFGGAGEAFGILMPMRADVQPLMPAFMKAVMASAAPRKARQLKASDATRVAA